MNQKEISELRRRFRPEKCAVSRIHGCYVNGSSREVISYLDESLGLLPQEEAEKYLGLLKKSLSGRLGRNLIDVVFSTKQVAEGDEHRLLMDLRDSELKNAEARDLFYQKVMDSLDMGDSNYIILLAHDAYDVPHRNKNDEVDGSDEVFSYILCCVCPVKGCKMELGYFPGENEFHSCAAGQIVSAPDLGFLFPAFDQRSANIYNALYYARKPEDLHQEFIDAVFRTEPPMSAAEQKESFQSALTEALGDACGLEVVQAVHGGLLGKIEAHKESRDPEAPAVTAGDVEDILADCGAAPEQTAAFLEQWNDRFGEGAVLNPENLIDSKRFDIKSDLVTISIDPEHSAMVETRIIDGRRCLLIPIESDVEINGIPMGLGTEAAEQEAT